MYVNPDESDFICSQPDDDGMTKCADILNYKLREDVVCNDSATAYTNYSTLSLDSTGSCVNWNQYYVMCKTGISNPYKGAISFDNIGLAWVAIFQVCRTNYYYIYNIRQYKLFWALTV